MPRVSHHVSRSALRRYWRMNTARAAASMIPTAKSSGWGMVAPVSVHSANGAWNTAKVAAPQRISTSSEPATVSVRGLRGLPIQEGRKGASTSSRASMDLPVK